MGEMENDETQSGKVGGIIFIETLLCVRHCARHLYTPFIFLPIQFKTNYWGYID